MLSEKQRKRRKARKFPQRAVDGESSREGKSQKKNARRQKERKRGGGR
jgi:hypothetical protein